MFSQWRNKRHYPLNEGPAPSPTEASQSDAGSPLSSTFKASLRSETRGSGFRSMGALSKAKGRKRDGSTASQPESTFAAGPRSNSRETHNFEFGGGVVPFSTTYKAREAEASPDSTWSPGARMACHQTGAGARSAVPVAIIGWDSPRTLHSPTSSSNYDSKTDKSSSQLTSIDEPTPFTEDDYEDLCSIVARAASPLSPLTNRTASPALTNSTPTTTPEVSYSDSSWSTSPASVNFMHQAPQIKRVLAPSIPHGKASTATEQSPKRSLAEALASLGSQLPKAHSPNPDPTESPRFLEEPHVLHRRGNSVSSFPETVSGPSSSQIESKEFTSPSESAAPPRPAKFRDGIKGQEVGNGSTRAEGHGLGIIGGVSNDLGLSKVSFYDTGARMARGMVESGDRLHRKSESTTWVQSVESWGRNSFMEISRRFADGPNENENLSTSYSNGKVTVSESDHSVNTVETSTDAHEPGPLDTINEKAEYTETQDARHKSGRGASLESMAIQSVSQDSTMTSSSRSSALTDEDPTPRSPLSRFRLVNSSAFASGTSTVDISRTPSLTNMGVAGISSPTFGFKAGSKKRPEESASATPRPELLPAAELNDSSSKLKPDEGTATPRELRESFNHLLNSSAESKQADASHIQDAELMESISSDPMPSAPFADAMQTSLVTNHVSGFISLPTTPNPGSSLPGKRRKARPAALSLNKSMTNLHAPLSASAMSPAGVLRGMPSPSRLRAPPPSAPPPSDPLPPLPNTSSTVAPKSPRIISRKSSAANMARLANANAQSLYADPLASPGPSWLLPKSPALYRRGSEPGLFSGPSPAFRRGSESGVSSHGIEKAAVLSLFQSSPLVKEPSSIVHVVKSTDELAAQEKLSGGVKDEDGATEYMLYTLAPPMADHGSLGPDVQPERLSSILDLASPHFNSFNARDSVISNASVESVTYDEAQVKVARTITKVPSMAIRVSGIKDGKSARVNDEKSIEMLKSATPSPTPSKGSAKAQVETGAPLSIVRRAKKSIENPHNAVTSPAPARPAEPKRVSTTPPSAWNRNFDQSNPFDRSKSVASSAADGNAVHGKAATDAGHGRVSDSVLDMRVGHDRRASVGSIQDRRLEMDADKVTLATATDEEANAQILKRTEGRFTGAFGEIAQAFRQLQAEKRALEVIVREQTPLDGLGENSEGLGNYLTEKNAKLEASTAEIRKLLDLLEQQRSVMDYMLETHRVEIDSYRDEIDQLHDALGAAQAQAEMHQAHALKLNEDLERAHLKTVAAKAESLKTRNIVTEDSAKREKALLLLRTAREELEEAESDKDQQADERQALSEQLQEMEAKHAEEKAELLTRMRSEREEAVARLEAELEDLRNQESLKSPPQRIMETPDFSNGYLSRAERAERQAAQPRKQLEERETEISQLRLSHTDAAIDWSDDASSTHALDADSTTEVKRLRAQLNEQRTRETQIRTAYKLLREELRKTQTGFQSERRRNPGAQVQSERQLKRLSLPLVAKPGPPPNSAEANGTFRPMTSGSSGSQPPPSSFRGPRTSIQLSGFNWPPRSPSNGLPYLAADGRTSIEEEAS